jgi:hypothetical protein
MEAFRRASTRAIITEKYNFRAYKLFAIPLATQWSVSSYQWQPKHPFNPLLDHMRHFHNCTRVYRHRQR